MTLDGQPILSGTVSSGQITDEQRASRKFSMTTDPSSGLNADLLDGLRFNRIRAILARSFW